MATLGFTFGKEAIGVAIEALLWGILPREALEPTEKPSLPTDLKVLPPENMTAELPPLSSETAELVRSKKPILRMPLRSLDPGQSKLSTMETKRIISVLDETIFKVELVSTFSYVTEHLEDFSMVFGPELTGAFREHIRLSNIMEASLKRIEEQQGLLYMGAAKGTFFGAQDPDGLLLLQIQGMQSSVRNIVRLLYVNTVACQALRDIVETRHQSAEIFTKSLWELRGFLLEHLLTTPLEEKEKSRFLNEISQRDKKNAQNVATLEMELTEAIQNRDEEISKMNSTIKDLKTQLHNVAKFSEGQIQRTKGEAEKQQKTETRGSQAKCAKLQQELNQLRTQLNNLIADNRESELNQRKKKYKVEMEIENWVQKYDTEMTEKQEEIEEIEAEYVVEKQQLAELREKFAKLDMEYSQIMEERRIKQEQKEKAEKELAILVRAATLIQAMWKGYLVRSVLRAKRKKKGKGRRGRK